MDITVYDKLYEALEIALNEFNNKSGFKANISSYSPDEPKYPLIIFTEVRNQPISRYTNYRDEISSLGYRVDIFAKTSVITLPNKTKTTKNKQQICRNLMEFVVDFLQYKIGLRLISNNPFDSVGTQGELYQIVLVFQQNHNDKREMFI